MSSLTIESLLQDLEAEVGMTKVASATTEQEKPALSEELEALLTKKASIDSAAASGKSLAQSILEKMANEVITETASMVADQDAATQPTVTSETDTVTDVLDGLVARAVASGAQPVDQVEAGAQTKQAEQEETEVTKEATLIEKIAQAVIEKLAAAEDLPAPANKIQEDAAEMVAQHDAMVQETPAGDGTVNQILDAIVADAKAKGAISADIAATGESASSAEGEGFVAATDEVEKAAAVSALVESGVNFADAVDMVKQAEAEIQAEGIEQEKRAAFEALIESGIDFDQAADMVKEASAKVYGE